MAPMHEYQQAFIDFAIETNVLRFGKFRLKSGRISPYFFNTGLFDSGASVARLGRFYAQAIQASKLEFDMLFGPAYKGIPLAVSTVIALADQHSRDIPYAFNRKEAKNHGEGGTTVGAPLQGRVLIIDDVISAGTSVRESIAIIKAAGAVPAGVIIALDRQERGQGGLSAIQEVEQRHGVPVFSIVSLNEILTRLDQQGCAAEAAGIRTYQQHYGAQAQTTR